MSGFFNYDNPVWRFIGKFWDLLVLHVLWLLCSLPIVTIGASTTAVYYVTLKLVRDEEGYIIKSFFKSFKENFKQSTIIWLIFMAVGLVIGIDMRFAMMSTGLSEFMRALLMAVFSVFLFLYIGMFLYTFPLQCRFYMPIRKTLLLSFFMVIRHLPSTLFLLLCDGTLLAAVVFIPQLMLLPIMFGFPLFAFINSFILVRVLDKYMPKEEEAAEEADI